MASSPNNYHNGFENLGLGQRYGGSDSEQKIGIRGQGGRGGSCTKVQPTGMQGRAEAMGTRYLSQMGLNLNSPGTIFAAGRAAVPDESGALDCSH